MKKLNFENRGGGGRTITLFFVLATLLSVYRLSAQGNNSTLQCGTPDIPIEHFLQLREKYVNKSESVNLSAAPVVPVWVYILRPSNGVGTLSSENAKTAVLGINQYFSGIFTFTVCGTTMVDSDTYYDFEISELVGLCNQVNNSTETLDDRCVKIFLTNTVTITGTPYGGYGFAPGEAGPDFDHSGVAVVASSFFLTKNIAHEIGHYFGLPHTFMGEQIVSTDFEICRNTGDGFCDTPADPGSPPCASSLDCNSVTCPTEPNDINGVPYSPDPKLLMSYYTSCANKFSGEQSVHMRALYQNDPDYAPLLGAHPCFFPQEGLVHSHCTGGSSTFIPLAELPISIQSQVALGATTCISTTTSNGIYFSPFNPLSTCSSIQTNYAVIPPKLLPSFNPTTPAYMQVDNGVNVFDLFLVKQLSIGNAINTSPYTYIAADANNSGTINSADELQLRFVLLGTSPVAPAGSWRYVPDIWATLPNTFAQQFFDDNPFDAEFVDPFLNFVRKYKSATGSQVNSDSWMDHIRIDVSDSEVLNPALWSMTAVKVGDLNCSFDPTPLAPDGDDDDSFVINADFNTSLTANSTQNISIVATSPAKIVAWQMALSYPMDKMGIQQAINADAGLTLTADNFSKIEDNTQNKGIFRSLWYSEDGIRNQIL